MAGERYLVDSNVLLRWIQAQDPLFPLARKAVQFLEDTGSVPCYASQNLGEFWNVLTRPSNRNGYGLPPAIAALHAEQIERHFLLLPETPAVHSMWRMILDRYAVCGVQVHDAHLVATMQVHGVRRILTFNHKDFARYPVVEAIHPRDVS